MRMTHKLTLDKVEEYVGTSVHIQFLAAASIGIGMTSINYNEVSSYVYMI